MGYQALLFCPDEKLARVVAQVFGDLDFSVDPVNEPFAAVKKLMAQRYDAIVVDCENEQNASLLFKSARNSASNQSSLAIALVEGQAGVAKAYRIGANLVLTKPINVEQAKGTLRVARGLLRKNSDAAGAPTAVTPLSERPVAPQPTSVASSQPLSQLSPGAPIQSVPLQSSKLPPRHSLRSPRAFFRLSPLQRMTKIYWLLFLTRPLTPIHRLLMNRLWTHKKSSHRLPTRAHRLAKKKRLTSQPRYPR